MNNNIVTLNLSVPALEKIFEGNPDFVISIRQAAVAEFAKRKIGDILDKSVKADVEAAVAKQVGTITNAGGYNQKITLQKPILDMIQAETQKTIDVHKQTIERLIRDMMTQAVEAQNEMIDEKINREVERRVNAEVQARVTTAVKERMNKVMSAAQF